MGLADVGMGAGATLLATDEELHAALEAAGWAPTVQRVASADPRAGEVTRIFDLLGALERDVRGAVARGAFPLVFAGGCISAAGTVAGAAPDAAVGAVWLDAHADLDTPDDNLSGSMDVMALSILTGSAWGALRSALPGARAVAEEHVALLGIRDLAAYQQERVARGRTRVASGAFDAAAAGEAIGRLPTPLYLHVDLDVLDTALGNANRFAAPGGPSLETVLATIDATFAHGRVAAAAITAYEPPSDRTGTILAAARTIATRIATHAHTQHHPT